ncbi:hypothetical protein ACQ4PT_022002 [Festuca glaucescens]
MQKRNWKTNIGITFFPVIICVLLIVLQNVINSELDKPKYRCGCACVETDINGTCKKRECGVQYSTLEQVWNCAIPSLPRWLALIQVPQPEFRAVKTVSQPFDDLPDPSCRDSWSCHASVLVTGRDRSFAESVAGGLFPAFSPTLNVTDYLDTLSRIVVIAFAFFVASFFSSVKIATVIGYIYVFGSGLLGAFLFLFFIEDRTFSGGWVLVMEIVLGFSLYRGLYELGQYAFSGSATGSSGMMWGNLKDPVNGMCDILIIMTVEWALLLELAFYLDQMSSVGGSVRNPLLLFRSSQKKHAPSLHKSSSAQQDSKVIVNMEKEDVAQERRLVEQLLMDRNANEAVICDNLRKMYPGRDGNPDKLAVRGLSLALPKGQCFGMLGPNGAGKTSFISMIVGLTRPTSGTAYAHGMDITMDMDDIYTNMGVCPQHDLLWETLTGKEHLFFYARLKNLKGAALVKAVDDSLKSVNLFHGGVGDKQVGMYSGGMKRRLSVAISLIGDPKVVYMDEPSTWLDPASRNNLWNIVKEAKRNCAIVLTTHSMEEAEVLCDRLGIFVDGEFQCIGNPKELKERYGGAYIFTVTTSPEQESEVDQLVRHLSPSANKIYNLSGTQKFELSKQEVRIADVFRAVEVVKSRFSIHAWGLVDTTLEDVFIKVAKGAEVFNDVA